MGYGDYEHVDERIRLTLFVHRHYAGAKGAVYQRRAPLRRVREMCIFGRKIVKDMTQITINLPNDAEAQWLVELLNRLRVSFQVDANDVKKRERAKEIIMRGANSLDIEQMLESVKQGRESRKLPLVEITIF